MEKGRIYKKRIYKCITESLCYTAELINTVKQLHFNKVFKKK